MNKNLENYKNLPKNESVIAQGDFWSSLMRVYIIYPIFK